MKNSSIQDDIIQSGLGKHDKLEGDLYNDNLALNKRAIKHQQRKMLFIEGLELGKVAFYWLGVLFFFAYACKVIFFNSALDHVATVFASTEENSFKTQIIYAAIIISYFITKAFGSKKK